MERIHTRTQQTKEEKQIIKDEIQRRQISFFATKKKKRIIIELYTKKRSVLFNLEENV